MSAGRAAHTYMDMVTSLWFMCTLGLPPGPDRDGRLFKKAFPPRAAQETSGRPEQSASSFIKHLRKRSLLDTRITFEIPPVTSQPPKHGSWSFKYLHVRTEEGFHLWERLRWNYMCSWQRGKDCFAFRGSQPATQKGLKGISLQRGSSVSVCPFIKFLFLFIFFHL